MAKFFMPLGAQYGTDTHPRHHVSALLGPYENDLAVSHAIEELYPNDKVSQFLVLDGVVVKGKPSPLEKPEAEKRVAGDLNKYRQVGEVYKCKDCGADIKGVTVAHPIHLREMPGSGFGECHYVEVPYCPNCEIRPSSSGAPVHYGDPGVKEG
jgi:hypothetical protein